MKDHKTAFRYGTEKKTETARHNLGIKCSKAYKKERESKVSVSTTTGATKTRLLSSI